MIWLKAAMIVFICTSMNHLGLIEAIEKVLGFKLAVVNCCKCSTFWVTYFYLGIVHNSLGFLTVIAISFLACFLAVWLELALGYIDTLYNKAYERIFNTSTVSETVGDKGDTETDDKGDTETKVS